MPFTTLGVNNSGAVVGIGQQPNEGPAKAFVSVGGSPIQGIFVFGGFQGGGISINDSGQITGFGRKNGNQDRHAFIYSLV